jgi:hypothetical protein
MSYNLRSQKNKSLPDSDNALNNRYFLCGCGRIRNRCVDNVPDDRQPVGTDHFTNGLFGVEKLMNISF